MAHISSLSCLHWRQKVALSFWVLRNAMICLMLNKSQGKTIVSKTIIKHSEREGCVVNVGRTNSKCAPWAVFSSAGWADSIAGQKLSVCVSVKQGPRTLPRTFLRHSPENPTGNCSWTFPTPHPLAHIPCWKLPPDFFSPRFAPAERQSPWDACYVKLSQLIYTAFLYYLSTDR